MDRSVARRNAASVACPRHLAGFFSVYIISHRCAYRVEFIQHVSLSHYQFGDTAQHHGIAQCNQVYPPATAWTACYGPKFVTGFLQRYTSFIVKLGRERSASYAGTICFSDAIYIADARGRHPKTVANTRGNGIG